MTCSPKKILLVEDEPGIRFAIHDFLGSKGFQVEEAETCLEAQRAFGAARPDAAILDYLLPDGDALELLPRLKSIDAGVPVIILTGHGSIDRAVRAIKEGAEQFLTKPVELPALLIILERALENHRNRQKTEAMSARWAGSNPDPFLGTSAAIRELRAQAERVVAADSPLLLLGETGSGKGLLAGWLHRNGPRSDEPFVDLNCAGLSREFLETELFGHERGAFTGAVSSKAGLLEVAHRGTLFLDEIGDVDLQVQPRLLKVLEEKRFRRLGAVGDRRVDVRLVAATHQDLGELMRQRRFREDLYFRISTVPLRMPPLRERLEDVPLLAAELLRRISADLGLGEVTLAPEALRALQEHCWPGNVRQLRNELERALLLSGRCPVLKLEDLRFDRGHQQAASAGTGLTLKELEKQHIARVLQEEGGHVARAAERLGVPRSTLYEKIKLHGIAGRKR